MTIGWYGRNGNPLAVEEANRLLGDMGYKRVASTTITSGVDPKHSVWVSTVWLGLDHGFLGSDFPIIFETMVWARDDLSEIYCERYATEAAAVAGHAEAVAEMIERMVGPAKVMPGEPPTVTDGLTEEHALARNAALEELKARMLEHRLEILPPQDLQPNTPIGDRSTAG